MRGLHHSKCCKFDGDNNMEHSPYYRSTQTLARLAKQRCEEVFNEFYNLRFANFTQCVFHSPFPLGGVVHENLGRAFDHLRRSRPDLCLSANHPKSIWLEEIKSSCPRDDGSVLAGFVVYK